MQKPETRFRAKIRPLLDSLPNSYWESIQQRAINGTPDILGCVNGYFVALELKRSKGKPTLLQKHKLEMIKHAHGIAIVLSPENWDDVYTGLKALSVCIHIDNEGMC